MQRKTYGAAGNRTRTGGTGGKGIKNLPVAIRPLEIADGCRRNTKLAAAHSLSLTVLRSHG